MFPSSAADAAAVKGRFAGSSADIRTILNFEVSAAAIQTVLPPGWEQDPPTSGPAAGTNLRATFVIPLSGSDASGTPYPDIRYVIFSVPAKRAGSGDQNHLMLLMGLTNGGPGPYDTNVNAKDAINQTVHYEGPSIVVEESWSFIGDDGSAVSMQMKYTRGLVVPNKAECRVFAQVNPAFSRIYKYQEGVDVVDGKGVAPARLKRFNFRAQGGRFSQFFDGAERLVSVIALPWYNREIYLPDT